MRRSTSSSLKTRSSALEEVSRIELGFPHDFPGRAYAYGNTFDLIDHHRGDVYAELDISPESVGARKDRKPAA